VRIIADENNSGDIVIGSDENVVATAGTTRRGDIALGAGVVMIMTATEPGEMIDLDKIYIDVTSAGDSVRWIVYGPALSIRVGTLLQ
jgi:hypothetical protein